MNLSISEQARQNRRAAIELAKKKKQLATERARRKVALDKRLLEVRRAEKKEINRILNNCHFSAYKGKTQRIFDLISPECLRNLKRMGFSIARKVIPHLKRASLANKLIVLQADKQALLKHLSWYEILVLKLPQNLRTTEWPPLLLSEEGIYKRAEKLEKCLKIIKYLKIKNDTENDELEFLRTSNELEVVKHYGFDGWTAVQAQKFRRQRIVAITDDLKCFATFQNYLPSTYDVAQFVEMAQRLINNILSFEEKIKATEKEIKGLKDRKGFEISWGTKPGTTQLKSPVYCKLFWISSKNGIKIFDDIFKSILSKASQSQSEFHIDALISTRGRTTLCYGKSKVDIPKYIEANDIKKRLNTEEFSASVIRNKNVSYKLIVNW
jgi:hypothetical protein